MSHPSWTLLFPGHGSQELSMGEIFWKDPYLKELRDNLLHEAPEGLAELRVNGPLDLLSQNRNLSSILYITSMLALETILRRGTPVRAALGYSVGQYAALAAARVFTPIEGLRLIQERARLMDRESQKESQGMLAVMGLTQEQVESVLREITTCGGRIFLSNLNALQHFTVAGREKDLETAETLFKKMRAFRIQRLSVSGAWHSPFMQGAASDFRRYLNQIQFSEPVFPVFDNVTGYPIILSSLKDSLAKHLYTPVQWYRSIKNCLEQGADRFVEVGHGRLLSKMLPFIERKAIITDLISLGQP